MRARRWALAGAVVLVAAAGVVGCGDDGGSAGPGVTVTRPWARTSPALTDAGAAYVTITSGAGDVLTAASVDPSVAMGAQIHETVTADGTTTMAGSTDTTMAGTGAMTMQEVEELVIPAGGTITMQPGGYHIMLMELTKPLINGATFMLTLTFEEAGDISIEVPVRDTPP